MAPTAKTKRNAEIFLDWHHAHLVSAQRGRLPRRQPEVTEYLTLLWPESMEYYSPLNPVFLVECVAAHAFRSHPHWMIRDGLVPLLWFFDSNPKPPQRPLPKGGRIWVHQDLAPHVPAAWRPHCGAYRLHAPGAPRAKLRGLVLTGLMMPVYCGLDGLDAQLERIEAHYGKRKLASMEIAAFLPASFMSWGSHPQHGYHAEYMLRVCRRLGTRVRALSWSELDATPSWEGFDAIDLNDGLLCKDGYLPHLLASRGARVVEPGARPRGEAEKIARISQFHGIAYSARLPGPARQAPRGEALVLAFEQAMRSDANQRFPWPRWFPKWAELARSSP